MFTNTQIQMMRNEINNPELITKRIAKEQEQRAFIENTRKLFKENGRDLDAEFESRYDEM